MTLAHNAGGSLTATHPYMDITETDIPRRRGRHHRQRLRRQRTDRNHSGVRSRSGHSAGSNRKVQRPFDRHKYKARHLIENLFARLKQFRRIATRYEKLARNFAAFVTIGCFMAWLR